MSNGAKLSVKGILDSQSKTFNLLQPPLLQPPLLLHPAGFPSAPVPHPAQAILFWFIILKNTYPCVRRSLKVHIYFQIHKDVQGIKGQRYGKLLTAYTGSALPLKMY
jgi:hypothetical protein